MSEKFISNKLTFIVLASACIVILVSMGLRQTFGLFFQAFEESLGVTRTEFGLAIGIQMIFWGIFAPIFGLLADKFGGNKAVFIGFIIFGLDGLAEKTIKEGVNSFPPGPLAFVLGAEGPGLREKTKRYCDLLVKIPSFNGEGSLNVSNATAVALYEIVYGNRS